MDGDDLANQWLSEVYEWMCGGREWLHLVVSVCTLPLLARSLPPSFSLPLPPPPLLPLPLPYAPPPPTRPSLTHSHMHGIAVVASMIISFSPFM